MQNQCEAYIQNLKMINKTIVENQQIIKMFPKIQTLSKFITQYKINQFLNVTQIINSHQYLDLLNSFKALTIQFDFKIHSKNTFPTHKIYSNAFFQRHKMYSFHLIIIPKGLQFSLHDHSDIFVITKLLYGQLIVQDMDIDQQYLKVVKFLRGKLQERRKNKFFVKKMPKSSNFLIQKKESTYSNPDNEIYTQQFYENCLKSKTYQNFDNTDCYKVKNWKTNILKNSGIKSLTPINQNIHRYVAQTDCIILNVFVCDNCDESKFRFYEYHQDFDEDYPFIFKSRFNGDQLNFFDLNDIL